jgi:hypothetical protein
MKYVINLLNEKRSQLAVALDQFAFLKGSNTYADTEKQIAEIDKAISILNGEIRESEKEFCPNCGKRIRMQGNGILEPLCTCNLLQNSLERT